MNWSNPKRIVAVIFFLVAFGFIAMTLMFALAGAGGSVCTAKEQAAGLSKCSTSPISGFLGGGICGSIFCLPIAFILFIIGAFVWSGAKKDDLRDLEIAAHHKGKNVDKKTEAI